MKMEIYFLLLVVNFNCTLPTSALHASPGKVGKLSSDVRWPLKARKETSTRKCKRRCLSNGSHVEASQEFVFGDILHISYISEMTILGHVGVCVRDETYQEKWDENQNPEFPVPLPDEVFLTQRFCFIIPRGLLRGLLLCFFEMKKNQRKLNLIKKSCSISLCAFWAIFWRENLCSRFCLLSLWSMCHPVLMCGENWLTCIMPSYQWHF